MWHKFVPTWFLLILMKRNVRLRESKQIEDKAYWVDSELFYRGITIHWDY